jgi:hypothetical protein
LRLRPLILPGIGKTMLAQHSERSLADTLPIRAIGQRLASPPLAAVAADVRGADGRERSGDLDDHGASLGAAIVTGADPSERSAEGLLVGGKVSIACGRAVGYLFHC